ncbi:MAG TPA: Rab family GTPase [Thermoplasmata archaeon]|jgi:small GTP-binding protein
MTETRHLAVKVTLLGDRAVGKTSLIRRFVLDQFDDRYLTTLGAKVSKKVAEVIVPERDVRVTVDLMIWDIMGQISFRDLFKEAYFHGSSGIIAVVDLTRRETLDGIGAWIRAVEDVTGKIPAVLVANKKDLTGRAAFGPPQLETAARNLGCVSFLTSAKTGENVRAAFQHIADRIVRAQYGL